MKSTQNLFRLGDCVKVKLGIKDPDWGSDISGLQGRILRNEKARRGKDSVLIEWESVTL
jgi:hypothetical protein